MKRLVALILLGVLSMTVVGCSGGSDTPTPKTTPDGKPVEPPGTPKDGV